MLRDEGSFVSLHTVKDGLLSLSSFLTPPISERFLRIFLFSEASVFLDLDWNQTPHHNWTCTIQGCDQLPAIQEIITSPFTTGLRSDGDFH